MRLWDFVFKVHKGFDFYLNFFNVFELNLLGFKLVKLLCFWSLKEG